MITPRLILGLLILWAVGVSPALVHAQATPTPPTTLPGFTVRETGATNEGIRISKIETYLVTASGMLEVRATIENHAGTDITGMSVGLELDQKGTIRDVFFHENRVSLRDGGTDVRVIDYFIPKSMSGNIEAFVVVRSLGGKTLAREPAWSGASSVAASSASPLSCAPKNMRVECAVGKGEYGLRYTVYRVAAGGEPFKMFSEEKAGGKIFVIPDTAPGPGDYVVSVRLISNFETRDSYLYRLSVPGTSGAIEELSLKRIGVSLYSVRAETAIKGSDSGTTTLALQWMDRATPCGEPTFVVLDGTSTETDIAKGCGSATNLRAELYLGDKKLASSIAFIQDGGRIDIRYTGIALATLLVIAIVTLVARKRFLGK